MKAALIALTCALLGGCAMTVSMMPRDSGQVSTGTLTGDGTGSGSMSVTVNGTTCSGPAVKVASNDSFGFANVYARNNRGGRASGFGTSFIQGDSFIKALLTCQGGGGIRCDLSGRNLHGGGICVDDKGRVFDVVVSPAH